MREHDFKIISQPYTTLPMTENICNRWNMCEHDFKIISKPYDLMTENKYWKMHDHDLKIISQSYLMHVCVSLAVFVLYIIEFIDAITFTESAIGH